MRILYAQFRFWGKVCLSMKLHYYPDTDSLYRTAHRAVGLIVDFDGDGNVVGLDIDGASKTLDLTSLEATYLPLVWDLYIYVTHDVGPINTYKRVSKRRYPVLKTFNSLVEMMKAIPVEQAAIDHIRVIRWKSGAFCPHCNSTKVYHFSDGRNHKCGECRKRFSIRVGTIFEDSKLPLRKWLLAIWLITSHKKGIASTQLAKDIGITQKSAWFVTQRLREAARTQSFNRPLDNESESDETFIGGKEKNKHAHKRTGGKPGGKGKIAVLGILERGGELRTMVTPNLQKGQVQGAVRAHVQKGAAIFTDEHPAFNGLWGDYSHHRVNHSAGEYVRHYLIHTNGIEGVWALFKRQIVGTHHYLSPKHIGRYLSEMTWRFNARANGRGRAS